MFADNNVNSSWYPFDDGKSIGLRGPESGKILSDIENINGARITIEQDAEYSPFAVTIGVYGIMFHSHPCGSELKAREFAEETRQRIENLFNHLSIPEDQQDSEWAETFNKMTGYISEQLR